ncbi:outer membrane beta-barrel protein [Hymenobacter sp. M29]|uniref:Outer membrane beta-barrel protein n=1 Tax=Hymenobacter mellowenesis TaxID=3063995 RepID=A0ABT9AD73_9BACT|nr:outer membrane beta-barrel protein [Hymenobacter sp. M29]MDO7846951.1 outer membrane beta-barrel protein [Hymenobacter sp. M29]
MKHFFTAALVLGALTAQAQQGSLYIGGQVGFNTSNTEVDGTGGSSTIRKASNYSFSPEIGTFLTNQLQLGVGVTVSGSRQETPISPNSTAISRTNRFGGTVYGRYFFGEGNFRPFLGLNVSVLPGNSTEESGGPFNSTTKYTTLDLGANLNAGFAYGLNTRWTVVGSFGTLGFQRSTSKRDDINYKTTTTDFGLNANTLGNLFTVGVYYTFREADK